MLLSTQVNKTKIAIVMVAVLFVTTPLYFASAFLDGIVYDFVVWFFGGLVGLCAMILNYGIQHFVVGFTDEFMTPTMNATINSIWTLIRDIFNITFIFGLVYIGFTMILKSDSRDTRKLLINIVIAALLVNFSLLISKVVIDVSNMTATQILNAGLNPDSGIFDLNADNEVDFALSMMNQMKIVTTFDETTKEYTTAGATNNSTGGQGKSIGYSIMLMLLFLITAFTFLSAGIMIIIRGAALLLFMVLSPLMFLGFVIPSLMSVTQRYWREFFARAFFAPIYILLVYISLALFQSVSSQQSIGSAMNAGGFGTPQTVASTFGPLALVIVMMISSLSIAKKLGVEGASTAMGMFDHAKKTTAKNMKQAGMYGVRKGTQAASSATIGVGSAALRHTLGRMSYNYTNSDKGKKLAAGGFASRQAAAVMKSLGNASYDPRSSKKDGMLGKSRTGGFAGHIERQQKKEKQRSKDLERDTKNHLGEDTKEFLEELDKSAEYKAAVAAAEATKAASGTEVAIKEGFANIKNEELKSEQAALNEWTEAAKAIEEAAKSGDYDLKVLKEKLAASSDPAEKTTLEGQIATREKDIVEHVKRSDRNYKDVLSRKETAANYVREAQKEYAAAQSDVEKAKKAAVDNQVKAGNAVEAVKTKVEGQYKYAIVGDLRKTRIKEQEGWEALKKYTFGATASLGTVGAAAGLVAGPVGAILGGAAGAALGAAIRGTIKKEVETAEARIGEITKEYGGKDLDKKIKDKGKRDLAKMMKEMDKEFGDGTSGAAAPETSS